MTFEELLQKVRESKNLHHVKTHYGLTFLSESYADDQHIFVWTVKHPGRGFEQSYRQILAAFSTCGGDSLEMLLLMPNQLFQLRETLNLHCEPWEEECCEVAPGDF